MQNSTYDPNSEDEFSKRFLNAYYKGVSATITAGQTQNIDYTLSDDMLITGAQLIASGSAWGDKCDFQVVHPTYGVVNQFVTDWFLISDNELKLNMDSKYPAKLFAGLTIRLVYHSTGGSNVNVAINYKLNKVLV